MEALTATHLVHDMTKRLFNLKSELQQQLCPHRWVSIKNPVVKNGSMCTDCGHLSPLEPDELVIKFPHTTVHP